MKLTLAPLVVTVGETVVSLSSGDSAVVGRDPAAEIPITDPRVSRHHLRIHAAAEGWVVEDLDSSNGTFHDGVRVTRLVIGGDPCRLRLGDVQSGPVVEVQARGRATAASPVASDTQDLGMEAALHVTPSGVTSLGRDPSNDIVLDDLMVSRHHAELRTGPAGTLEIHDLGSHNGTFVNGRRVYRAEVAVNDIISIGRHRLVLTPAGVQQYEERGGVAYAAAGLHVRTRDGLVLLDGISFALDQATFLGVVGPSGAGKSTLVRALTGARPADRGTVFYAGRDLYSEYEHLRRLIGFVPQDDILHKQLTIRQTLEYAAELRFPPDVAASERNRRVAEVLEELGLADRAEVKIVDLSGGQRKRVSVAVELLVEPSLLILDEPTSGLDPGYERSLMILLEQLARAGRTVVVVTHSVQSLHLCDRVMCLAPGGRMAWFGPPDELVEYFGRDDYQEVFAYLSDAPGEGWQQQFAVHPDYRRYVAEPLSRYRPAAGPRSTARLPRWAWWRQFSVLTRRQLVADRKALAYMVGLAVVLGLVLLVALPAGELEQLSLPEIRLASRATLVLFILVLAATQLGAGNAIREIVKELPLYRRERAVGLSISAYVASKVLVLGTVTLVQTVVLTLVSLARQNGPEDAILLGWPLGELIFVMALTALAAMALGLAASALLPSVDRAMMVLPVILILQMVLASGGVFPGVGDQPVLKQAGYVASAQWGLAGAAATSDLNELRRMSTLAMELPVVDLADPIGLAEALLSVGGGPERFSHTPTAWLGSVAALTVLTVFFVLVAGVALRRHDAA